MKNLFTYYLLIIAPLVILIWLNQADLVSGWWFIGLFLLYALVYHTYIDGKRLVGKDIIEKKEIWKMIIPGSRLAHFQELYLR